MKLRSFFYSLITIVVVLLLTSTAGLFWLTARSPLSLLGGGGKANPAATIFVPKQAPIVASLLVNPDRLEAFRLASVPLNKRRQARAELAQLKQSLLSSTQLDYEQDIQPWLGDEITLAVTTPDVDRDDANGLQPGYLVAIATQDAERSNEFLQLFWQRRAVAGVDLVFEQYAGVRLIYGTETKPDLASVAPQPSGVDVASLHPTLVSAVVGDRFVLFANYPKVLRDAITNVQALDLSLSSSRDYQDALRRLPDRQIGLAFVNLPQLTEWLTKGRGENSSNVTRASRLYERLVMTLELEQGGLVADTALLTAAGETLTSARPALSKPVNALNFIPTISPLAAAGENLEQLWTQIQKGVSAYSTLATLVDQPLADLAKQWGLESTTDLVDWVTGEYALGLIPRRDRPQPDWVFAAKRNADVTAAIARFDTIAKQQGLSSGVFPLGDRQVAAWTKLSPTSATNSSLIALQADVQAVHTSIDDYELFATSVEALSQAIQAPQSSLLASNRLKQAIAALDSNNDGYLYLDWLNLRDVLEQRLPVVRLVELSIKPLFEHLRSLTVTSYGHEPTIQRGAVFIQLKEL
ncbi:DUF3352 domain-containing protein [Oculatella sp. LEGE 06141]|uniref:DUF3352 domain-containing protein n=1 Tax=Oculatella sp. LEGE 06141 TaxID=1828648 RepID=UPI00187F12E1|nr:DUF3352 domain-containing protein [Oculatella sp. LEGE 06141]MBE9182570.1 DUF3352 domain-containing protein [Oculatella sp. LEGE 06141]